MAKIMGKKGTLCGPNSYKEKELIEWQSLKLRKGQTVQEYTDGFRKMALMLDIPLQT